MATKKPRYGGATSYMDDSEQTCYTNMADKLLSRDAWIPKLPLESANEMLESQEAKMGRCIDSSDLCLDHTADAAKTEGLPSQPNSKLTENGILPDVPFDLDGDHLQCLLQVFEKIGIESQPKPYLPGAVVDGSTGSHIRSEPVVDGSTGSHIGSEPVFDSSTGSHVGSEPETLPASSTVTGENHVVFCKNLFLKDRRGQFYIVVCQEECSVNLRMLKQELHAHRNLSFGDNDALRKVLHLNPGEITPLAIMHESAKDVRVAVQSKLAESRADVKFAFHPLRRDMQVELSYIELVAFIEYFGKSVEVISEETLNKSNDSLCHDLNLMGAKPKQGLKLVREKSKKQSLLAREDSKDILSRFASPNDSVRDSSVEPGSCCSSLAMVSMKEKETSAVLIPQAAILPVSANMLTPAGHGQSQRSGQVHGNSQKSSPDPQDNLLRDDGQAVSEGRCTSGQNVEQIKALKKEFDDQRAPMEADVSNRSSAVHSISDEQELVLRGMHVTQEPMESKTRKKRLFISRKGKLRSYVRKNTLDSLNTETGAGSSSEIWPTDQPNDDINTSCTSAVSDICEAVETTSVSMFDDGKTDSLSEEFERTVSTQKIGTGFPRTDLSIKALQKITSTPEHGEILENCSKELGMKQVEEIDMKIEIIERFYSSLSESMIKYEEIDLSIDGDGTNIKPSVGCRCFLMKDKGGNFFFIISHELYEPDFGRLKAALRPKKKILVAHPADVVTVLGVDPMRVTPFAVFTMGDPQPQVFMTRKVLAPNLVLCIQHPFAQARRILLTSAELQKYLRSLRITFQAVEERHWHPKFNVPFSQFDTLHDQSGSGSTDKAPEVKDEIISPSILDSDPDTRVEAQNSQLGFFNDLRFFQFLSVPFHILTHNVFPSSVYSYLFNSEAGNKNRCILKVSGSSVDAPDVQTIKDVRVSGSKSKLKERVVGSSYSDSEQLHTEAISLPMTTECLEKHLLSLGVSVRLKREKGHEVDVQRNLHQNYKENEIIEQCSIMHLTNSTGHNFLIVGAQDEFPMSVKRFCRRNRIGEHLTIRLDPQEDLASHLLCDIAPNMMPFALAFPDLRAFIWERFRTSPGIWGNSEPTVLEAKSLQAQTSVDSLEQTVCPGVTVVLTTTLYIDPETVMEFTVGQERSRLRITSSEFEKFSRKVGFEIVYY